MKKIIVVDFETTDKIPETCSPCQIGAIVIDPMTLQFIPGSEFNSMMRPDPARINPDTLKWHANLNKTTEAEILKKWEAAPPQKQVWLDFAKYTEKYNLNPARPTMSGSPILAGFNVIAYDCVIMEELSRMYGTVNKEGKCNLFFRRDTLDLMKHMWWWFENNPDVTSYTLDNLRDYFGLSKDNAHDAFQDVVDTGTLVIKFIQLHRYLAPKVKFKDSCKSKVL